MSIAISSLSVNLIDPYSKSPPNPRGIYIERAVAHLDLNRSITPVPGMKITDEAARKIFDEVKSRRQQFLSQYGIKNENDLKNSYLNEPKKGRIISFRNILRQVVALRTDSSFLDIKGLDFWEYSDAIQPKFTLYFSSSLDTAFAKRVINLPFKQNDCVLELTLLPSADKTEIIDVYEKMASRFDSRFIDLLKSNSFGFKRMNRVVDIDLQKQYPEIFEKPTSLEVFGSMPLEDLERIEKIFTNVTRLPKLTEVECKDAQGE